MKNNNSLSLIFSFVSFFCSIIGIFVMYYVFTGIALVLGIATIQNERSRYLSISTLVVIFVTVLLKLIKCAIEGNLPSWLTGGLF